MFLECCEGVVSSLLAKKKGQNAKYFLNRLLFWYFTMQTKHTPLVFSTNANAKLCFLQQIHVEITIACMI